MNRFKRAVGRPGLLALLALLPAGCGGYEPAPVSTRAAGLSLVSHTADQSANVVVPSGSLDRFCQQPPPDATFSQAANGDMDISLISTGSRSEGGGGGESSAEGEMTGRTPTLLIARELFYRACELSMNHRLDARTALDLHLKTLSAVQAVWSIEAKNTTVTIHDADTVSVRDAPATGAYAPLPPAATPPARSSGPAADGPDDGSTGGRAVSARPLNDDGGFSTQDDDGSATSVSLSDDDVTAATPTASDRLRPPAAENDDRAQNDGTNAVAAPSDDDDESDDDDDGDDDGSGDDDGDDADS